MRAERLEQRKLDTRNIGEWRVLAQSSVVAAVAVARSGAIVAGNAAFAALLGQPIEKLRGRPILELLPEARDREQWQEALTEGAGRDLELEFMLEGGGRCSVRGDICSPGAEGESTVVWGLFVDVSEQQQLRRAMQRGARLEALGSLTSGVAHDFNNLLTVLVGNLSLVAEELREQPAFAKLKAARDAARRGADLIGQLLAFARRESLEAEAIDPGRIIENLASLLRRALGSKIELTTDLEPGAGPIRGNAAILESVIVNLAVNARDAVERDGRVTISVKNVSLSAQDARKRDLHCRECVCIEVADNGKGIAPDVLEHVFEPFYSTKLDSGGTGLGLSMVRSFVAQAAGTVGIESTPGQGTTVSMLLPRSNDLLSETNAGTMPLSILPVGDERVLVLATEEGLRSMIRQVLEVLGYDVGFVGNARELEETLAERAMDLLIIDGSLAGEVTRLDAVPKGQRSIVLTTGAEASPADLECWSRILRKPFSLADLATSVRDVLDAG